ncbi:MAG: exo-alpha-sialidase [Rhodocyclales bacterium]|nr:exo-alpha-sialidase [Rhodocyclales bacterium]
MLKSLAFRSRMPLRSLVVVGMVGFLAGCGGGGGGGGSEPAPAPQKPALALSWQPVAFTTPEVTDPGQPPRSAVVGDFGDVAATPGGGVHLAWREQKADWPNGIPYVSRSHDAGATWQTLAVDRASGEFAFMTTLASGRLVAGSTVSLPQQPWRTPRIWWSDDEGVTWSFQDVQSDIPAPDALSGTLSHEEIPVRMVEKNGKVVVWVRSVTTAIPGGNSPPPSVKNRLYYWEAGSATLTRLPIALPRFPGPQPFPAEDYYEIEAIAGDPNGFLYIAIDGDVVRTDNPMLWSLLPQPRSDANLTALTVLADGTLVAGLDNYANLYFYKHGSGWSQSLLPKDQPDLFDSNAALTRPFLVKQILELHSGALLASTWTYVYASCDRGASWERIEPGPGGYVYRPIRMAQGPDGTVWGSFYTLESDPVGTGGFQGLLKIQPPAGVAPRDFVKCP